MVRVRDHWKASGLRRMGTETGRRAVALVKQEGQNLRKVKVKVKVRADGQRARAKARSAVRCIMPGTVREVMTMTGKMVMKGRGKETKKKKTTTTTTERTSSSVGSAKWMLRPQMVSLEIAAVHSKHPLQWYPLQIRTWMASEMEVLTSLRFLLLRRPNRNQSHRHSHSQIRRRLMLQ